MADVDFDAFTVPRLPILQITKPSTFVKVKEKLNRSIFLRMDEPLTKYFTKCSGGDKQVIEYDYEMLMKLRIFFKKASNDEK